MSLADSGVSATNPSTREFWSKAVPMTFEGESKTYEEKRRFRYSLQDYMHDAFPFSELKGRKVLEVGVGSGIDSAEFLRSGAIVTGMDFSPTAIRNSKLLWKQAGVDGNIVLADATTIPFRASEFDAVYSYGVIHHIPDVLKVVGEINRVLKRGGVFFGMVYNRDSLLYAYSIIYVKGIRGELLARGASELDLSSSFSERLSGNRYTKLYTVNSLTEMLRGFFSSVEVRPYYNVIDRLDKRKVKFELEDHTTDLGWHLVFKAIK